MTQYTGDSGANTYTVDSWESAAYCVFSYANTDSVRLGSGDDLVFAGNDADTLRGGPGDDHLRGEAGNDSVRGGPGGDLLHGNADDDDLDGNEGDDELRGGTGNDTIRGGAGVDAAYGEDGDDIFVIGSPCEVVSGEVIDGGAGSDKIRSPLTSTQLASMGLSITSIETFETIAYDHSECLVVDMTLGADAPKRPGDDLYVAAAINDDGSALVTSTHQHVYSISTGGTITDLRSGDRVVLSPTGHSFGVLDNSVPAFKVYDAANSLQSTLAISSSGIFRMFPGSNYVFAPEGVVGHDNVEFTGVEVYTLGGSLHGDYAAADLRIVHLTPTHVIHTTTTDVVKTEIDGDEAWRVELPLRHLDVSQGSTTRFIALPYSDRNAVIHFEEDGTPTSTSFAGVPWDLSMSPSGEFSALTVQTQQGVAPRVLMFQDGALAAAVELPAAYANSVAATDNGEILIGAQTAAADARLLAYHYSGTLLWQSDLYEEMGGYRPKVVPSPSGDRFAALATAGLHTFHIDRSPTP